MSPPDRALTAREPAGRQRAHPVLRPAARDAETSNAAPAAILAAIADGVATNRADLARRLGIAPSTVTKQVGTLLRDGVLRETGGGRATGGRRPRVLEPARGVGHLRVVSIGHRVGRVGLLDLTGSLQTAVDVPVDPRGSVESVLDVVLRAAADLAAGAGHGPARGIGIALPGPVDVVAGTVDSAAALPGWTGFPVREHVRARAGLPVVLENDANALALGEHAARAGRRDGVRSLLAVKAGAALGCGLVLDGRLVRGATSVAGDIAHVRVREAGEAPCACGDRGCLETIVGHAGISRALGESGVRTDSPADTVRLVRAGVPQAIAQVARAGAALGSTLAPVVNFVNPHVLVLGGPLADCAPFRSAVSDELRRRCHPLAVRALTIETALTGADAELTGIGQLALRAALAAF